MRARRVIERVWGWLSEEQRAIEILVALLFIQLIAIVLPQSPVPATQSAGFTQWVAQLRPALGRWTHPLSVLGLLTIRSSALFRIMLAFLGLLAAVRIDALRETWRKMRSAVHYAPLLFCIGGFLIISGWAIQMLWGWAVPETVNWSNTPIVIAEHTLTLSPKPSRLLVWTEKYGVYLIRTGWAVGLEITAADDAGRPLSMLRSSKDKLQDNLQVILTGTPPEAFFLTPETELVYRLHQLEDKYDAPIFAQVYRSASGELLAEAVLKDGEDFVVETTHVSMTRTKLPRNRILYNPGAPVEAAGMILLTASVILQARKIDDAKPDGNSRVENTAVTG
jgi:hypothetical protein